MNTSFCVIDDVVAEILATGDEGVVPKTDVFYCFDFPITDSVFGMCVSRLRSRSLSYLRSNNLTKKKKKMA